MTLRGSTLALGWHDGRVFRTIDTRTWRISRPVPATTARAGGARTIVRRGRRERRCARAPRRRRARPPAPAPPRIRTAATRVAGVPHAILVGCGGSRSSSTHSRAASPRRLERVEQELRAAGEVTTLRTERPRHAVDLAHEACADGYDAIVGFSGDGGYNELLNGLEHGTPVGFVPGGGTSVLPRALRLPREPVPAARQVAQALRRAHARISLGRVNGVRFAFQAGIGFDADRPQGRRPRTLFRRPPSRRPRLPARDRLGDHGDNGRFRLTLEIKGLGRAAFAVIANTDPQTFAGRSASTSPPAPASSSASTSPRRSTSARARCLASSPRASSAAASTAPARSTGHDLDRVEIVCDAPSRSRPTGRISAT